MQKPDADSTAGAHRGAVVWLTGLSASGKTTTAAGILTWLRHHNVPAAGFDGDDVRKGLCKDLGFSPDDRAENVRRVARAARDLAVAGSVVVVSLISPYRAGRSAARALCNEAALPFIEIHVDCPLDVAEARDPKGLYKKARAGLLHDFTGIDAPYEAPIGPDVRIDTSRWEPDDAVSQVTVHLIQRGVVPSP